MSDETPPTRPPLRIAHISDAHGRADDMLWTIEEVPDLWVSTGDFFPNQSYGDLSVEPRFQAGWFRRNATRIREALRDRPILVVDGNHDFIPLGENLRRIGVNAIDVPYDGIEVEGVRFAGFREIPYINGRWAGELYPQEFVRIVDRVFDADPTVLVTHAPPAGILSGPWGVTALTPALAYRTHRIRTHLFGHVHEYGGHLYEEYDVRFVNSAETVTVLSIDRG